MPPAKTASPRKPTFFVGPAEFRVWLEVHHATKKELWVGFYKRGTAKPSITWPESVDEALCFGWIDGVRQSLGDDAYTIRFTPRKPTSIWSAINVDKVAELTKNGKMREAGLRAFAARTAERTGVYSFERSEVAKLTARQEKETRERRLAQLMTDSAAQRTIPPLTRPTATKPRAR
jgi:uncharacterized protein YdeI (YjbR/CyaY-like superfamily)